MLECKEEWSRKEVNVSVTNPCQDFLSLSQHHWSVSWITSESKSVDKCPGINKQVPPWHHLVVRIFLCPHQQSLLRCSLVIWELIIKGTSALVCIDWYCKVTSHSHQKLWPSGQWVYECNTLTSFNWSCSTVTLFSFSIEGSRWWRWFNSAVCRLLQAVLGEYEMKGEPHLAKLQLKKTNLIIPHLDPWSMMIFITFRLLPLATSLSPSSPLRPHSVNMTSALPSPRCCRRRPQIRSQHQQSKKLKRWHKLFPENPEFESMSMLTWWRKSSSYLISALDSICKLAQLSPTLTFP